MSSTPVDTGLMKTIAQFDADGTGSTGSLLRADEPGEGETLEEGLECEGSWEDVDEVCVNGGIYDDSEDISGSRNGVTRSREDMIGVGFLGVGVSGHEDMLGLGVSGVSGDSVGMDMRKDKSTAMSNAMSKHHDSNMNVTCVCGKPMTANMMREAVGVAPTCVRSCPDLLFLSKAKSKDQDTGESPKGDEAPIPEREEALRATITATAAGKG